jgi:DNA topoisomerase-6 subunit B
MTATLQRSTFSTSRALEFFSEKELQMQIGHSRMYWPIVLVKELIDNALDACEQAGIAPDITISLERDAVTVRDNGPGLPFSTLKDSLDYMVRVSNKSHYVSPTRGQLGNALKCVWAAPFVVSGTKGCVDVETGGQRHTITVGLDRIHEQPLIELTSESGGFVENGTLVRMHWPRIASYLDGTEYPSFYKSDLFSLVSSYSTFNRHATFELQMNGFCTTTWHRTDAHWNKWLPQQPTSPHWYTPMQLWALIAAYLTEEQAGGRARTVREFVAEFNGLSAPPKQKAVTTTAGLSRAYLHDLVQGGEVNVEAIQELWAAMQAEARPVRPEALGILGQDHLTHQLTAYLHASPPSIRYKKVEGVANGLPFVLECAFGVYTDDYSGCGRQLSIGLNWTPVLGCRSPRCLTSSAPCVSIPMIPSSSCSTWPVRVSSLRTEAR